MGNGEHVPFDVATYTDRVKAVGAALRVMTLVAVVTISDVTAFTQPDLQTKPQTAELQDVLFQARRAVIKLAAEDTATWDGHISAVIKELVDLCLFADDRESVRDLQQHLKEQYAAELRHALDPAKTRQDFSKRIAALADADRNERNRAFEDIVAQQLERSMYADALDTAERVTSPVIQAYLRRRVAIRSYPENPLVSARAVDAFIQSALEPRDRRPDGAGLAAEFLPDSVELLSQFANELKEAGAVDDARRVLMAAHLMARFSGKPDASAAVAVAAASIGDGEIALEALAQVQEKDKRRAVEDRLKAELAKRTDPDGQQIAVTLMDVQSRSNALLEIARREADSGNRGRAGTAFTLARQAAHLDDQDVVFLLVDVAKAQIGVGDADAAQITLSEALAENEQPRVESDQLSGWAYAAAVAASMGDFARAHAIAARIDSHYHRAHALRSIAYYHTFAGQLSDTKAWASRLKDPDERSAAFLGIAAATVEQMRKRDR